ncbi:MAG TPA: hypothetical protein VN328_08880, partial [Thermodesulfovibrionales bacterium]|nr:hypothetical protein [Thermodesulfovibrionales bacterium]
DISIIGADKRLVPPKELAGLAGSDKLVYKEGACGKGLGIVFARLHIAYPNAARPKGLLVGVVKIMFERSS